MPPEHKMDKQTDKTFLIQNSSDNNDFVGNSIQPETSFSLSFSLSIQSSESTIVFFKVNITTLQSISHFTFEIHKAQTRNKNSKQYEHSVRINRNEIFPQKKQIS